MASLETNYRLVQTNKGYEYDLKIGQKTDLKKHVLCQKSYDKCFRIALTALGTNEPVEVQLGSKKIKVFLENEINSEDEQDEFIRKLYLGAEIFKKMIDENHTKRVVAKKKSSIDCYKTTLIISATALAVVGSMALAYSSNNP